jgi:hypothetical protein
MQYSPSTRVTAMVARVFTIGNWAMRISVG